MPVVPFLRKLFLSLPLTMGQRVRVVDAVYRVAGPMFRGVPHYQAWLRSRASRGLDGIVLPVSQDCSLEEIMTELKLPYPDDPLVSVVIPSYGNLRLTAACLRSVAFACEGLSYEVIVSDDASPDAEIDRLASVPGLRYIRQEHNQGFVGNCNAAASIARGNYVFFLNNDTQMLAGAVKALLSTFEIFNDCGMAGAMLVYPDGRLQEAGGIVWNDASAWNYGRFDDPTRAEYKYVREVDYCSGAALMIRRDLFESLKGFSVEFSPAYYEDTDLAFKVRESGLKVYYQPAACVVHFEGVSNGTSLDSGLKRFQAVNAERLRRKWALVLAAEHFPNGCHIVQARERARKARTVVIVDQYVPRSDRDAGSRSVMHVIETLLQMGFRVKFWPHNLWYDPGYTEKLQAIGVEVIYGKEFSDQFAAWIKAQSENLQAVILNRPLVARHYINVVRQFSRARIVFYGHDLHWARMARENELGSAVHSEAEIKQMQLLEARLWRESDVALYPSAEEVEQVCLSDPCKLAFQIPLYCFDEFPLARVFRSNRRRLVFVAGFRHPPNIDGAVWLVREVMPAVWARFPTAELHIVGSAPNEKVLALKQERVAVFADVSDEELAMQYAAADVAVVPLRFGAGVKGKVVEALRDGLPLVTTSIGAQGLPLVEQCISVADDPDEFAASVCRLLESDEDWQRMSKAMSAYAREHFTRQAMRGVLQKSIGLPVDSIATVTELVV